MKNQTWGQKQVITISGYQEDLHAYTLKWEGQFECRNHTPTVIHISFGHRNKRRQNKKSSYLYVNCGKDRCKSVLQVALIGQQGDHTWSCLPFPFVFVVVMTTTTKTTESLVGKARIIPLLLDKCTLPLNAAKSNWKLFGQEQLSQWCIKQSYQNRHRPKTISLH